MNMIVILIAIAVLIVWGILCFFKYQKWHIRKERCTKLVHARVVEVQKKGTATGQQCNL